MALFGRQVLAIGTAAILLIVQALPSVAVCVCGKETPMSCCSSRAEKDAAESQCGCGHASDAETSASHRQKAPASPSHCERMSPQAGSATPTSMAGSDCKKIDVAPNLISAEAPQSPEVVSMEFDCGVVIVPTQWELPTLDFRYPYQQMRGPPLEPPGQLYLLHSSFLL